MELYRVNNRIVSSIFFIMLSFHSVTVAYDPLDPDGNIAIKWDILSWTSDGYVAVVTMNNFQMYRQIMSPGWTMGWTWSNKEIIWSIVGAQAIDEGDCTNYKGNIPHSCMRSPKIIDLLPGVPYNQQFSKCCKGGVVASWGQDPSAAVSAFQVSVGQAGNTNHTVRLPKDFTLLGPGLGYSCSPAVLGPPSVFPSPDGRRRSRARMTWTVTCTYSRLMASKNPNCCVSLSSFYNPTITHCPSCACGCQNTNNCLPSDSKIQSAIGANKPTEGNSLQCTEHMCPVRVHWHVKSIYKEHWRVKITVTNFNYHFNYTQWTMVAQHPNLNKLSQVFSFVYKPLLPYQSTNDTGMFHGIKFYNDALLEAGPDGNLQTEIILEKDKKMFTLKQGWVFPRLIYFNGDECRMPLPDSYPFLPNTAYADQITKPALVGFVTLLSLAIW